MVYLEVEAWVVKLTGSPEVTVDTSRKLEYFTREMQINPSDVQTNLFFANWELQRHQIIEVCLRMFVCDIKALGILTKAIEQMTHPVPMAELLEVRAFIKGSIGEIEVVKILRSK